MRRILSPESLLLAAVALLLACGGVGWLLDAEVVADALWAAGTGVALLPATWWVVQELRNRRYGADLLAVLALASTLATGEYLAGAVVALMVATGRLLEASAGRRAGRDLSALLERAPHDAHLRRGGQVETVPVERVRAGDRVVVLPGEVVPVDGTALTEGVFDESALTGESAPVVRQAGDTVRSGVVNTGAAVDIEAVATAEASTYAGVVRLAEQAAAGTAPVARLADRVAVWFLPLALLIAGAAWAASADPVRAVAVLVTATPCPLLLAVPIAVTGGMSRTSRSGVVVKGGAALELLGHAKSLVMDKTGTVTAGRPEVTDIICGPGFGTDEVLRLAGAVEQYSPHVLAEAVLRAVRRAGVEPASADGVSEEPGRGAVGTVGGRQVRLGRLAADRALPAWARAAARRGRLDLASVVWVEVDDELACALLVRDRIRFDAARTMRRLRAVGVEHVLLLTGDRVDNAREVAGMLGLDEVQAQASPSDKIERVRAQRELGTTIMVGDGVNDAPALAAADVGIALGSRGSTAAVQAADAVIVDDRIDRLADAVEIARRSRRLAVQSAGAGTVLSLLAMLAAAGGWLIPVLGAVVQEGIDIAVIANALRSLRMPQRGGRHDEADALLRRFAAEHEELEPARAAVRQAADALSDGAGPRADVAVRRAYEVLTERLLPHEAAEETELYPALAEVLGTEEGTLTMSRGHAEIQRLARRLGRHLAETPEGILPDQVDDLRAVLYGLDAVLTLHFAQEEEAYFTLAAERS
ncbi:heavy metal translocating P-type ATPase [Saccharomonospora amisosensis]|uniref:Heavy metal translocating P-type ATPase n=1 Tax=Saccharomonospora amisosensis TaxID=1128677 RepID=A0A7X5UQQ2_9PSEU|nr:heavy metal translocating P-type ATPase [Saccharomonospora amisosensis]NIJ12425.1 heavy metal translocating P-type ATPase [Saccharomonospora amisosensis]